MESPSGIKRNETLAMETYSDKNSDKGNEISRFVGYSDSIDVRTDIQRGLNVFNMKFDLSSALQNFQLWHFVARGK